MAAPLIVRNSAMVRSMNLTQRLPRSINGHESEQCGREAMQSKRIRILLIPEKLFLAMLVLALISPASALRAHKRTRDFRHAGRHGTRFRNR